MSGRKEGVKVVVGNRREGVKKVPSSSNRRDGAEKVGSSSSSTKGPVPKARNLPASLENNREEEESELTIMERRGEIYQSGLTVSIAVSGSLRLWSGTFGSFEDTKKAPLLGAFPIPTLQVFSVKLCETRENLKLPVDVFGMVVMRDCIDHNRNIIFYRRREDCQTLTQEDPYLVLEGPTRAVLLAMSDPVIIEVALSVKGATESEDKYLSFLVAKVFCANKLDSCLVIYSYTSKLSTLEFRLGHIISSVEPTITMSLIEGSWASSYRGIFGVSALGCPPVFADNVDAEEIILLDSGGKKLPVTSDGKIKLSRHVVSVETGGKLQFYINVLARGKNVKRETREFRSSKDGKSSDIFNMGFCKMQVTVNWSLISFYPAPRDCAAEKQKVGM